MKGILLEPVRQALERWRWSITLTCTLLVTMYLALGFGLPITPSKQFLALQAQDLAEQTARIHNDQANALRIDSLVRELSHSTTLIEGLARVRCQETPSLAAMAGLPCRTLLGGR